MSEVSTCCGQPCPYKFCPNCGSDKRLDDYVATQALNNRIQQEIAIDYDGPKWFCFSQKRLGPPKESNDRYTSYGHDGDVESEPYLSMVVRQPKGGYGFELEFTEWKKEAGGMFMEMFNVEVPTSYKGKTQDVTITRKGHKRIRVEDDPGYNEAESDWEREGQESKEFAYEQLAFWAKRVRELEGYLDHQQGSAEGAASPLASAREKTSKKLLTPKLPSARNRSQS